MDHLQAALLMSAFLLHKSSIPIHTNVNIVGLSYFCE